MVLPEAANCATSADVGSLGSLSAGVGVNLGIEYHNVYVLAGSQNVIQTAEADVVCPAVAAEDPNGLLSEVFLVSQNILAVRAACCCALFELCNQRLGRLSVSSAVVLGIHEGVDGILEVVRSLLGASHLLELGDQALTESFLAVVHAEAVLCVILEQGVCPCRTVALSIDGVRGGSSRAAPDRRTAGSVGDVHAVAADLSNQAGVRGLSAACAGAGELKQRLLELRILDGIYGSHIFLLGNLCYAVIEGILLSSFLILRNHGQRLGRADADTYAAAHAVERRYSHGVLVLALALAGLDVDELRRLRSASSLFVCPHATIRPFALTDEEAAGAPESAKLVDIKAGKGKGKYKYTMAVSPLDCMGCGVCIGVCPTKSLTMVPQDQEAAQQDTFDYCVAKVSEKEDMASVNSVKDSQFKKPLLEFSGSCAGCAETSYARLVTQVCGDRMYISNATGCSSIWGGPAATSPYTVNAEGHGPAWANSLFEDNAEHGLGMYYGQEALRERLISKLEEMAGSEKASDDFKNAVNTFMDTKDNGAANAEPTKALVAELEKGAAAGCPDCKDVLAHKEYLAKKSVWIFGGDGWAYDIGFGGLDHVLASGKDVNVMVFDTEVYSNTGGQASKATNIGQLLHSSQLPVRTTKKKSLAEIAMSYGYVYVAQVAMGANHGSDSQGYR